MLLRSPGPLALGERARTDSNKDIAAMTPVNSFNRALVRDAIGKSERFGLWRLLHHADGQGGLRRHTRPSTRQIECRGKTHNGAREKHSNRGAASDVSADFAFRFYLLLPLITPLRDLPAEVRQKVQKWFSLIDPSTGASEPIHPRVALRKEG